MSSEKKVDHRTAVEKARTIVAPYESDEVAQARAELQAALWAIEQKANYPQRIGRASQRALARFQRFGERQPAIAIAGAVTVAAAVGGAVWGIATLIAKPRG
ncbi:hypothetical protein [uncultured Microbacterium sp.]|uniref:hypothetical protein n=1 Tax=uncultured Microbacterium sp. TaxID=191216 RepID=UPI0025EEA909|nr:hypothetical protein [uncultured Microbacterium sp.]